MTKNEALSDFKKHIVPHVIRKYGNNDKPAIREAWNNYVDALVKSNQVSTRANDWVNPF